MLMDGRINNKMFATQAANQEFHTRLKGSVANTPLHHDRGPGFVSRRVPRHGEQGR